MPRPHRFKIDGSISSIEASIKVANDDVYNLSASKKYYIYYHVNEFDNTVFYIGKGSGNRAAYANSRSDIWKRHVLSINYKYRIEIHEEGLTHDEAIKLEEKYILEHYPLGHLVNQLTAKQRQKINVLK